MNIHVINIISILKVYYSGATSNMLSKLVDLTDVRISSSFCVILFKIKEDAT